METVNKRYWAFLALLLVGTLFVDTSFCSNSSTAVLAVFPQDYKVGAGEIFTTDVLVFDVLDLHRWTMTVEWDPSVLNLQRYEEGPFLGGGVKTATTDGGCLPGGIYELSCTLLEDRSGVSGSGAIAHLVFDAMTVGSTGIRITFSDLVNSRGESIQHSVSGGSVEVFQVAHDVAVVDVTPWAEEVYAGETLNVSVVVKNEGTETEAFNVAAFADTILLGTKTVMDLAPEDEESLIFTWMTTNVLPDNYTISANASIVCEETDLADNVFIGEAVKVVDAVAVYVDPSRIVFTTPAHGRSFNLDIDVLNTTDLYAFELSLAWNSSVISLVNHMIVPIWLEGQYYVVADVVDVEAGTCLVAVTSLGNMPAHDLGSEAEAIASFTFEAVLDPCYPKVISSPILLEARLSDPDGSEIDCYTRSADYVIRSARPRVLVSPPKLDFKVDDANFTLRIRIMDATYVTGFSFRLRYDPTLLDVTEAVFGDFLEGPYEKMGLNINDTTGNVHLSMEQTYPPNGTGTLAMITFRVRRTIIYRWRAGEIKSLSCYLRLEETELNVTYPQHGILRQGKAEVLVSIAAYTFTPTPGDLNLDGNVDIGDLVVIASHYECGVGCPYDLNGDGIVDIYDIVLVALSYGRES